MEPRTQVIEPSDVTKGVTVLVFAFALIAQRICALMRDCVRDHASQLFALTWEVL